MQLTNTIVIVRLKNQFDLSRTPAPSIQLLCKTIEYISSCTHIQLFRFLFTPSNSVNTYITLTVSLQYKTIKSGLHVHITRLQLNETKLYGRVSYHK